MLLFLDGMAHYDTSRIALKYSALDATACAWSVAAEGRFGNCIKRVGAAGSTSGGYLDVAPLMTRSGVWTPTASGVCGFAIKANDWALQNPNENGPEIPGALFAILDQSNFALKVIVSATGTLSLIQPWGPFDGYGAVIAISSEGLTANAWAYVEFKWVLHASAGSFEIRVNTVPVLTYTGDTSSHNPAWMATGKWNAVRLLPFVNNAGSAPFHTVQMCDFYLADLVAADPDDVHDFLGDGLVQAIFPNAPGATTGWTPSGGANWDMTNDKPAPDDDGTYVRTLAPGTVDLYNFEDIPTGAVVKGTQINILARKDAEGSATVAPVVREGGVDYVGPAQGVSNITYDRYLTQPYDVNPATLAPWTDTDVNSGQFGVKKVL